MKVKTKIKKWPWWVKGGVCGILLYVASVVIALTAFAISARFYKTMPELLFRPLAHLFQFFVFFSFYPAMYLNNNYEALDFIIPVNLLFYCLVGVVVAFVVKTIKEGVELV